MCNLGCEAIEWASFDGTGLGQVNFYVLTEKGYARREQLEGKYDRANMFRMNADIVPMNPIDA